MVHTSNPSSQEAEKEGSRVQGQPGLWSKTLSQKNNGWKYGPVVESLPCLCKAWVQSYHIQQKEYLEKYFSHRELIGQ